MFSDPAFRIALGFSLLVHVAVVAPHAFFSSEKEIKRVETVDLNYIVIDESRLAEEEEVYSGGVAGKTASERKEKIPSSTDRERSLTAAAGDSEEEARPEDRLSPEEEKAGADREVAFLEYYNLVRERIRAEIHSASEGSEKGAATLMFTLDAGGHLQGIDSVASDISPATERKVIRGIKRAQPFPSFPEELGPDPVDFLLTVKFSKS